MCILRSDVSDIRCMEYFVLLYLMKWCDLAPQNIILWFLVSYMNGFVFLLHLCLFFFNYYSNIVATWFQRLSYGFEYCRNRSSDVIPINALIIQVLDMLRVDLLPFWKVLNANVPRLQWFFLFVTSKNPSVNFTQKNGFVVEAEI